MKNIIIKIKKYIKWTNHLKNLTVLALNPSTIETSSSNPVQYSSNNFLWSALEKSHFTKL